MTKTRVVVAENHPSVRENLRYLINAEPDMECVAVARNGRQCIELCRQLLPEILVVDEILPGADGLAIAAIGRGDSALLNVAARAPAELLDVGEK